MNRYTECGLFMKYYSAMKKNEVLIHATTWMSLENMFSERSQTQKATCCMIALIRNVQNRPIHVGTSRLVSTAGMGDGGWGWGIVAKHCGVSVWGDENVLELDGGGGCTTLRIY